MEREKHCQGFCPDCGSILPNLIDSFVVCYSCKRKWADSVFKDMKSSFTLHFNNISLYEDKKKDKDEAEGPIIDRECPQCGNDKMSYATLQLRSADEGQTVFYTCIKCKHKETENS